MALRAIETRYKGCRFRSRLEARWAVFFDSLEMPWVYEKEGFDLGDGVWYLPDFWLPKEECWFEVKGEYPLMPDLDKAYRLAVQSKQNVFVQYGNIGTPHVTKDVATRTAEILDGAVAMMFAYRQEGEPGAFLEPRMWLWQESAADGSIGLWPYNELINGLSPMAKSFAGAVYVGEGRCHDSPRITAAFEAARSARFERPVT